MTKEFTARLNEQEQQRYEKLARLRARGIEPYPLRTTRTHTAREAIDAFTRDEKLDGAILAGRLVAFRDMGKLTFAHLQDGSGKIQLMFRKDQVGEDNYAVLLKEYDLGDYIGAEGNLFRTKTGEITLQVARFQLLAKTL
ncbi:MAG: lysine--tRNA ligase, partial [Chloroflexi bacterium]|nr:lysine--tRNA ligase [Chloroflexota bacterium]